MKGWFGNRYAHSLASRGIKNERHEHIMPTPEKGQNTYYTVSYEVGEHLATDQFKNKKSAMEFAEDLQKEGHHVLMTKVCIKWKEFGWDTTRDEWVMDTKTGELGEYIGDD